MSHPASRRWHARDAAQPPEGSVMKELFSSRGYGRARECVFWRPLVREWEFCSDATLSGKRRLLKKSMC
jgi:hypothetical protein